MVDENGMDGHTTMQPEKYHPIAWLCYTWAEPVGWVPERLHLFPREEGCRGRHGEAAIVTPSAAVVVVVV